jgi:hypothetical protein
VAKDKVASGTALRQTNLRDLTRSVAAAPVEQAMKVIVDVDMVGMTLDGAGFQCAVVCRARSRRKLQTSVGSTRWQLPKAPSRSSAGSRGRSTGPPDKIPFLVNPTIAYM